MKKTRPSETVEDVVRRAIEELNDFTIELTGSVNDDVYMDWLDEDPEGMGAAIRSYIAKQKADK